MQGRRPMVASNTTANLRPESSWNLTDSLPHDDLSGRSVPSPAVDSILEGFGNLGTKTTATSSMPAFDKPFYDDDVFVGVPGTRNSLNSAPFDVFESTSLNSAPQYEDLLQNLGKPMPELKRFGAGEKLDGDGFGDLIPGFSPPEIRESPLISQQGSTGSFAKPTVDMIDDPFVISESTSTSGVSSSGLSDNPLDQITGSMNSGSIKFGTSASGEILDETGAFSGLQNSMSAFKNKNNENRKESHFSAIQNNKNTTRQFSGKESTRQTSSDGFEDILPKMQTFKLSSIETKSVGNNFRSSESYGRIAKENQSPKSELVETVNEVWLFVSEIPLCTQPTSTPPPSRQPPPLVTRQTSFGTNVNTIDKKTIMKPNHDPFNAKDPMPRSVVSQIEELEDFVDFVMGKPEVYAQCQVDGFTKEEEYEANFAEAAMKEAMDRAEAKFKHAKEIREREAKSKEFMQKERDEKTKVLEKDSEDRESQERLDWEQKQQELQERDKEQKRLQREKEQELEKQRERAKQVVDRVAREARGRAAIEARKKAEEKAAVEARQRAERAAVQRVAAEARERAATLARERAAAEAREKSAKDKAAVEAQERADREKSERIAASRDAATAQLRAERVAAQAQARAVAGTRENAAAAARERQQKPEDDLESFFGMDSRATSTPKARATVVESMFGGETQNKSGSDVTRRSSSTSSSNIRKTSSAANIADDLTFLFGGPPPSGEFQEIDGESEERRQSRLDRHQRTHERAAKALAEKNKRDLQTQREQAERHRIGERLDTEIKRWAAGKEGNLRTLLLTLQYVLWPECGWQPVSMTDLIMGASVKKVYRRAMLCVHPDKVQQKGATLQQKYIAEKVFDLLKEAWNKFNSEELL